MKIDELNSNHMIACEGKVLRRLSDGWVSGSEIYLGYTYRIGNEELETPLLELPEHYEEIDDPALEEVVLLDEATDIVEIIPVSIEVAEETELLPEEPIPEQPKRVTLADYNRLLSEVDQIKKLLGL